MKTLLITTLLSLLLAVPTLYAGDNMEAFPVAEAGMSRNVLQLPAMAEEAALRVELIVGKTLLLEERNHYAFGGRIENENIEGWGFTRYIVRDLGPMMGTMMAIDPNARKVERFISISGEPYLIRYNSRLPVVVYVPEGVEVRYRIWSAGAETLMMEEG